MKYELFKPDDFRDIYKKIMKQGYLSKGAGSMWEPDYQPDDIAKEVNEKLQDLIESWPVVKGFKCNEHGFLFGERTVGDDTHIIYKARLAFIEPIVKEPCKHEPIMFQDSERSLAISPKCKHCGVSLKATWEIK